MITIWYHETIFIFHPHLLCGYGYWSGLKVSLLKYVKILTMKPPNYKQTKKNTIIACWIIDYPTRSIKRPAKCELLHHLNGEDFRRFVWLVRMPPSSRCF